jgi:alpha-ketoglutarate-dependent taurine dioxygenase
MSNLTVIERQPQIDNRFKNCEILILKDQEKKGLEEVCEEIHIETGNHSSYEIVINKILQFMPNIRNCLPRLARNIQNLNSCNNNTGLLLVKNLPPSNSKSLVLLIAEILGSTAKIEGEGDYIMDIKEKSNSFEKRPSYENTKAFYLHTDLSYIFNPPLFIGMHCQANNIEDGGYSIFCDLNVILQSLSSMTLGELQKPQFLFEAPSHYNGNSIVKFPILTRSDNSDSWSIRFRKDNLKSETASGSEAIVELIEAMNKNSFEIMPEKNSIVLLNNKSFLHGRTAYFGGNKINPRHLNRVYVNSR